MSDCGIAGIVAPDARAQSVPPPIGGRHCSSEGPLLRLAPCRHPRIHLPCEEVERHRALLEHPIVELTDVEAWPKPALCIGAQLANPQLPHLVAERLSRIDEIPIHFDDDVLVGLRRLL